MREVVTYCIAATALVALISNVHAMWRAGDLKRDVPGWFSLVVVVLGGLLYEARMVPAGQPMQLVLFGLMLGLLVFSAVARLRIRATTSTRTGARSLLPAAIAGVMFLVNAVNNIEIPLFQSFGRLLAVAILIVAALIAMLGKLGIAELYRVITLSVLVILVLSITRTDNWRPCDIFKCGPFGAIYTGPFSSENALAIFACVAILCILGSSKPLNGAISLIPVGLVLVATESRTSQLALACSLSLMLILNLINRADGSRAKGYKEKPLRHAVLKYNLVALIIAAVFATAFYMILSADPVSFSNRGNIWIRGINALGDSWSVGLGLDRWTFLQTVGLLPQLFPHSQYLLLLFGGGIAAVLLLFILFAATLSEAKSNAVVFGHVAGYVLFLAILGLTEAYWNPIAFDGHTMLVLPLIFILVGRSNIGSDHLIQIPNVGERYKDLRRTHAIRLKELRP